MGERINVKWKRALEALELEKQNNEEVTVSKKEITEVQKLISEECDALKALLLEKNKKYGNSAIEPQRVFSKQNNIEQIKVRIDDKLSRIKTSGTKGVDEDTCKDLAGYLILLRVAERLNESK